MTLEETMQQLESLGKVLMSGEQGEWWCQCSLYMTKAGAEYTVRSNFKHKTATEAAKLCLERITSE
jgi:hypothetical protein